jgi:hypothetical protein
LCVKQDIADIYEKEEDYLKAMEYYDKAADLYSGENVDSTSNQCKLKVAQYAAQMEQYVLLFLPARLFLLSYAHNLLLVWFG